METPLPHAVEPFRPPRLRPFTSNFAKRVASWIVGAQEMYWLAPRTKPPVTAETVLGWQAPGYAPRLLVDSAGVRPVAYGELNVLNAATDHYWLGHLLVDPAHRGRGLGALLTSSLIDEAFAERRARRVSLVVFPENARAIACYRRIGLVEAGRETHEFPVYRRRVSLLRMCITPGLWRRRSQ